MDKKCIKCNIEYPATSAFFNKNKNFSDGLFVWCKKCKKESDSRSYIKNIKKGTKEIGNLE